MYYDKIAPWDHCPKNLCFKEVQNPLMVVVDFFSASWPKRHRNDLKVWRHYVVSDRYYNDKPHGPGTLLFIYDLNIKLVEALHLLWLDYKNNWHKDIVTNQQQLENEKKEWVYFPGNLSEEELLNPYKALGKCFKKMKPYAYREQLHDWLHTALYNDAADETLSAADIIGLYKNMQRLYSAAWVIHQRFTDKVITHKAVGESKVNECQYKGKDIQLKQIDGNLTERELLGLNEVQKSILEKVPCTRMIVCIGTADNPFSYYLVILIDDSEKMREHEISNKIEDNCRYLANICAIVHKTSSAIKGVQNAQRFWTNVFLKGRTVYTASDVQLPPLSEISKEDLLERAKFHWQRWGTQGKAFLKGAESYYSEDNYNLAAFLLHQSVESVLKSIIQAIIGYRVQIHNLSRLFLLTLLFTDALQNVFELGTEGNDKAYTLLRGSYADARYNNDFEVDKETVEDLIAKTKALIDTAERIYDQYTKGL